MSEILTARQLLKQADLEVARAERLLEIAHAAHRLSVSQQTVRRWIRLGKIAAVKSPGGQWRIAQHALDAFRP